MKNSLLLLLLCALFACNSSDDPVCCTNIDIGVSIKYLNTDGENLISLGEFTESNIEVYHKIDGDWVRFFNGNLDAPKGITIIENEGVSYLQIFPSTTTNTDGISETKIEFSTSDFDILQTEINKNAGNEVVTKVWYNNELKWEAPQNDRTFEVVK